VYAPCRKTGYVLVDAVYNGCGIDELVVRNIDVVDVRCAEDEVDYGLDG
jgi:hypothetical protein